MAARKSTTAVEADTTSEPQGNATTEAAVESEGPTESTTHEAAVAGQAAPEPSDTDATTPDELVAAAQGEPESTVSTSAELPETTTLDSDTTAPSTTAPGDGPADTTDPRELASSAPFYPGPDALAAGTVNAVQKVGEVPDPAADRDDSDDVVLVDAVVVHNLETGATSVTAAE